MGSKVSLAEYARHRGVSRAAVTQAVAQGRIQTSLDDNGKKVIDVQAADQAWQANTRHDKRVNGLGKRPPPEAQTSVEPEKPDASPSTEKESAKLPSIVSSRQLHEAYKARLSKIQYDEKVGKVLPADEVLKEAYDIGKIIRQHLENMPARLSGEFAAETDAHKIEERWTTELRAALEELQNVGKLRRSRQ